MLTCPLVPETKGLIDAKALAAMRRSAFLVNTARGGCVVESALIEALRDGAIAGAALDVTDPEPAEQNSPLWAMPNVFITPHTGGETRQVRGQRQRDPGGESRAHVARRDRTAQPGRLTH